MNGIETSWTLVDDDLGIWSRPIETMDHPIELYGDEWVDFPPLVAAQQRITRLEKALEEVIGKLNLVDALDLVEVLGDDEGIDND